MKPNELKDFLVANVEPLEDPNIGKRYRAAAYLIDGTYLPCIVFQSRQGRLELALRRFKQCRWKREQYRMVVETFVAGGSHVADYDLKAVELSRFAWPIAIMKTIHGETTMGWTAFVAEMKDKTMYSYGTDFRMEFFDLPNGYTYEDILRIHSGMVYSDKRGLEKFSLEAMREAQTLREKPFFACYLKEL
ncbi:MAG: hypothetical protein WCE61_05685 [Candidatus Acidiferrum sp.]